MTVLQYILNNINQKNGEIKNINDIPNLNNSMLTVRKKTLIDDINSILIHSDNYNKQILPDIKSDDKTVSIEFNNKSNKRDEHPISENYFFPKQKDSLFWCIYIFRYGLNKYHNVSNYGNKELSEKQSCIKHIDTNKNLLKTGNYKITNINIQEIKSDLMTVQTSTSFHVLIAFVFFYNINIYIMHNNNKMFLKFTNDINTTTHVIIKDKYKFKIMKMNVEHHEIEELTKNKFCLEHFNKPIKGASTYKVSDLHNIARVLNIDNYLTYKKNELYQLIQLQLIWDV